jgi:hypothetical protein
MASFPHDSSTAFFADGFSSMEQLATGFLPNKAFKKTGEDDVLFVTGLIVSAQGFDLSWGVGWAAFGKNVIQPALCLAVALLIGMPVEQTK